MNTEVETMERITQPAEAVKKNKCVTVAEEAKQKKMWIYHTDIMRWYHPDEFLKLYGSFDHLDSFLEKVQLRSPFEGIKTELADIDDRNKKLKQFVGQVIEYFTEHKD